MASSSVVSIMFTVDTEFIWRDDGDPVDWRNIYERSYEAAGVGVEYQLAILARHNLKACFFIDPMPACVYGIEPIRRMVAPILAAGQEIQLHLHPRWTEPRTPSTPDPGQLARYSREAQTDLIGRARDLLIEAGAPTPIAFRGGNYSADDDTLAALAALGFEFDSSHNGHLHPWPSAIGLAATQVAPVRRHGVTEIPVSLIRDGRTCRHLQLCAVSFAEMKAALWHARREEWPVVTLVTHSFELANRSGERPNPVHVKRFNKLCAFLADARHQFSTTCFADLHDVPLDQPATLMPARPIRRLGRWLGQGWSNLVGEGLSGPKYRRAT